MHLTLDLAPSLLVISAGFSQPVTTLRQSYGEGSRIEIEVLREGVLVTPTGLEEFAFVVKAQGEYAAAAPILAGCETFVWDAAIARWVGEINYNVPALTEQLFLATTETDQAKYLTLAAQLIWRVNSTAGQQRSQVIETFYLDNTIWKGTELFPATGLPLEASSTPSGIPSAKVLAADVTNATVTIADVTGLSVAVQAGQFYHFRAIVPFTSTLLTNGSRFSITGPASPTSLVYRSSVPTGAAAQKLNEGLTAYNLPAATSTDSLLTGNLAIVEGIIKPSVDGTLKVLFASELAAGNSITAKAGACLFLTRLS